MTDGHDSDMHDRLAKLGRDLDARNAGPQAKSDASFAGPNNIGSAMSTGFRVMSEFVAPGALIVFLALGTAAGFWTVYRIASRPTHGIGQR